MNTMWICMPAPGDLATPTAHPTREEAEAVAVRGEYIVGPYHLSVAASTRLGRMTRPTSTGEPREDEL
jgi:hypothetical protein